MIATLKSQTNTHIWVCEQVCMCVCGKIFANILWVFKQRFILYIYMYLYGANGQRKLQVERWILFSFNTFSVLTDCECVCVCMSVRVCVNGCMCLSIVQGFVGTCFIFHDNSIYCCSGGFKDEMRLSVLRFMLQGSIKTST